MQGPLGQVGSGGIGIDADAVRTRRRLEHGGELETGTAPDVEHAAGTALRDRPGQHVRDQRLEPLGEPRDQRAVLGDVPAPRPAGEHGRHVPVDGGVQSGEALVARPDQVVVHDRPAAPR